MVASAVKMIHQTDDELQNVCACVCVCIPGKRIHLVHEHFKRSSKDTLLTPFRCKVSLKLIEFDGKALTGC